MALSVFPTHTGWNADAWIKQPLTPEQSELRMRLADALSRKNDGRLRIGERREAMSQADEYVQALKARKDQSRVGGLPPEPMPAGDGDVTVIEKGAGPQPVALPQGVAAGAETPFTPVPEDRFAQPAETQMASAEQIRDAFARRQAAETPMTQPVTMANVALPSPRPVGRSEYEFDLPEQQKPIYEAATARGNPSGAGMTFAPEDLVDDGTPTIPQWRPSTGRALESTVVDWGDTNRSGVTDLATAKLGRLSEIWRQQPIRLNSAYRDPEYNRKVGGARNSQHTHGNAFDVSTRGWSEEDKQSFVDAALSAGFNGIGVYKNSIHIDIGSRRAWGPSYGWDSAPAWALAKVNNAEPATDETWITNGETMTADAGAASSPIMAFNGENIMDPSMDPQAALVQAIMAQQRAAETGYAQPQGGGNWAPMVGPAQTELAQSAPIVAGGGNVRPVSFGGEADVASPEQIDNRKKLAAAMLASGQGAQQIDHPLQGVAQVARAAAGAYGMHRANQQENEHRQALADALLAVQNGGSADGLARLDPDLYLQVQRQEAAQQARAAEIARQDAIRREDRQWAIEDRNYAADNREPPASVQEFEYGQEYPEYAQHQMDLERAGATNIDLGKEDYRFIADRAGQLQEVVSGLDSIVEARAALDSAGGTITGAGAETVRLPLARIGAAFGVTDPAIVENTETLGSELAKRVLTQLALMKGAPSNRDLEFVQKAAGGEISLNEGSIRRLLDIAENTMYRAIERHNNAFDEVAAGDEKLARMAPFYRIELPERQIPEAARMLSFPPGVPDAVREQAMQAIREAGNSPSAAAKIQQRINQQFGGDAFGGR